MLTTLKDYFVRDHLPDAPAGAFVSDIQISRTKTVFTLHQERKDVYLVDNQTMNTTLLASPGTNIAISDSVVAVNAIHFHRKVLNQTDIYDFNGNRIGSLYNATKPILDNGRIFVPYGSTLKMYDRFLTPLGTLIHPFSDGSFDQGSIAVDGDYVAVGRADRARIDVMSVSTQSILYTLTVPNYRGIAMNNGFLAVICGSGALETVHIYDSWNGCVRQVLDDWKDFYHDDDEPFRSVETVALAEDRLMVGVWPGLSEVEVIYVYMFNGYVWILEQQFESDGCDSEGTKVATAPNIGAFAFNVYDNTPTFSFVWFDDAASTMLVNADCSRCNNMLAISAWSVTLLVLLFRWQRGATKSQTP